MAAVSRSSLSFAQGGETLVDAVDARGLTALHVAALAGHPQLVGVLDKEFGASTAFPRADPRIRAALIAEAQRTGVSLAGRTPAAIHAIEARSVQMLLRYGMCVGGGRVA